MTTLLVKFVASASTLMLLLPAGWCRGWDCCQTKATSVAVSTESSATDALAADTHHSRGSCCQKHAATAPEHSENLTVEYVRATSPAHSTANCCCTQGKQATDKVAAANDLLVSPLATIAPAVAIERDQLPLAAVVVSPCDAGPPLRILHCVWRC